MKIMFGGAAWSGLSTNATTLSSIRDSRYRRFDVAAASKNVEHCDHKSAEKAFNLIQIKDVNFKNAARPCGNTMLKVKPIGRRKELP